MQQTNERIKLAIEFTKQLDKLAFNFVDFSQKFEQELRDLQVKSSTIIELLKINSTENFGSNISVRQTETEYNVNEEEEEETILSNQLINNKTIYPLKDCKVIINRLEEDRLKLKDFVTKPNHKEDDESRRINSLCNVDNFLKGFLNKSTRIEDDESTNGVINDTLNDFNLNVSTATTITNGNSLKKNKKDNSDEDISLEDDYQSTIEINTDEISTNFKENLENDIAKAKIDEIMEASESDIEIDDLLKDDDDDDKKKKENKTYNHKLRSKTKPPLVPSIHLNLIKSPVQSDEEKSEESTLLRLNLSNGSASLENEDEPLSNSNTIEEDEDSIKQKKVKKTKIFESEDEKSSVSKEDDNSKSSSSSNTRVTRSSRRNKSNGNKKEKEKAKNKEEIDEIVIDEDDTDFEEVVQSAKKRKIRNKKNLDDDEDSEIESNKKKSKIKEDAVETRRRIRKIIDDSKLKQDTVEALKQEQERIKRIEKQKLLSESHQEEPTVIGDSDIEEIKELDKTLSPVKPITIKNSSGLYLDAAKLIQVDNKIATKLKKHQIEGIKFMFESCYESVEEIKKGNRGDGCILAHCMGLGKTFQVVSFVHTLVAHAEMTKTKRIIVLTPVNALLNWRQEFQDWLRSCDKRVNIFDLTTAKTIKERLRVMEDWFRKSGVLILGYTMFTNIVTAKTIKKKNIREDIEKYLINPGADLVVCDEGHILKNEKTATSKAVNRVNTKRRIVLTGSPLQNNLNEYHCMTSFVKPSLLGTIKEFRNRFVIPINNGQHADSTEADVQYMKKRAHVLHKTLAGCVQRMDYTIIKPLIPPKHEFVISIRLSDLQQKLYKMYLEREGYSKVSKIGKIMGAKLFSDFNNLYRIWSHPWVLKMQFEQKQINDAKKLHRDLLDDDEEEEEEDEDNLSDLIDDNDDEDENDNGSVILDDDNSNSAKSVKRGKNKRKTRSAKLNGADSSSKSSVGSPAQDSEPAWWDDLIEDDMEYKISISGKMEVFFEILQRCEEINDKILVFSHSLFSLELIEKFLKHWTKTKRSRWLPLVDYFRIDGSTEGLNRKKYINEFNDPTSEVRLFLISTKAGGIGINLVGANRVIIFDASWNPVHDLQSIFRVYRFGQVKPVYIYRFLAQGTMEEKIYHRQVAKQSLALRVIDEHQLDRHFTSTELRELYIFDPDIVDENKPKTVHNLPPDPLLADLLKSCDKWISKYHEHDSLLENRLDEGLNEEERRNAWNEYEQEKQGINLRHQQEMQQFSLRQQLLQQMQQGQLHQQMQQEMAMNAANNFPLMYNMMQNGHDPDIQKMIPNYQQLIANEQLRQQLQQQQQQQLRQQLQQQILARELENSVNSKKIQNNLIAKRGSYPH